MRIFTMEDKCRYIQVVFAVKANSENKGDK